MKEEIRREMLLKRQFHHSGGGHIHCIGIMDRFLRLPQFNSSKCIMLYASKESEVHTDGIIQSALSLGKRVALPATIRESKSLEIYEAKSLEELKPGAFGILEPPRTEERRIEPSEVDLVVVPGVSFDRRGHRIGYGMGYYDSLLGRIKAVKIGLAYDMQLLPHVPNEPHDVAVDFIVTENETIPCRDAGKGHLGASGGKPLRVAVLASGRGTDFQSLIDAKARGELSGVELVGLITDNPQAGAIDRAKAAGIPHFVVSHSSREELDAKIKEKLDGLSPGLVVLAGYMKIIRDPALLSAYKGRMINIHPSLLPKYPGAHAQRDAFEAGEKISGYTIHFVDSSLDGGQIIFQEKVDICGCKSADEAAAKILEREHAGLPAVVGRFARGEIGAGAGSLHAAVL